MDASWCDLAKRPMDSDLWWLEKDKLVEANIKV